MSTVTISKETKQSLPQEFDDLFREHYPLVYRSAYSVVFNAEDAEDVVQTVFLRILRNGLPSEITNAKGYLYRAAVNEALNVVRSRRNTQSAHRIQFEKIAEPETPDRASSMAASIAKAMAQLPASAVELLVLRYEHNYSDAEIAKMLGKSRGMIAVALFRARARLKRLLAGGQQ